LVEQVTLNHRVAGSNPAPPTIPLPLQNVAGWVTLSNMKNFLIALMFFIFTASPSFADVHPCAADARTRAGMLMRFHFVMEAGDPATKLATDEVLNMGFEGKLAVMQPIKAPVGKGKFDVLEVNGFIYKATYRMHFIYAQIKGSCALMGQEILEMSNPY
jgi:hypothetical protein